MVDYAAVSQATRRVVVVLSCVLAAGCACTKHAQTPEPVLDVPPEASSPEVKPPAEVAPVAEVALPPADTPAAQPTPIPPPPPANQPVPPVAKATAPQAAVAKATVAAPPSVQTTPVKQPPKAPIAVAVAPAPAPRVVPPAATAAPVAPAPAAAAPLDLKSLETRLRQTRAIGALTKLSLKNQVDDLLGAFRAYHKRKSATTLPELRRAYDMLLLKVLSLLQDSDPPLARDIVRSRSAIWGILADPRKFTESNLMAGATP